jgi:hypothetical protein
MAKGIFVFRPFLNLKRAKTFVQSFPKKKKGPKLLCKAFPKKRGG